MNHRVNRDITKEMLGLKGNPERVIINKGQLVKAGTPNRSYTMITVEHNNGNNYYIIKGEWLDYGQL